MFSPKEYFDKTYEVISKEVNVTSCILIANRVVKLKSNSQELFDVFFNSVSHTKIPNQDQFDLEIWISNLKGVKAPNKNWEFNVQGYCYQLDQSNYRIFYQHWIKQIFMYSESDKVGIYWVKSERHVAWWEPTFSFRIIFHWWTKSLNAQLIHAGCMAIDENNGWIISGPSGSGKSSTCLELLDGGYHYLGDDYIWVELQNDEIEVYSIYQTAKVNPDNFADRFSYLNDLLHNSENFHDQKAILNIRNLEGDRILEKTMIRGIILPEVKAEHETAIIECSSSEAFINIAPTTMHHLPHDRNISFKKIKSLSTRLNSYKLIVGKKHSKVSKLLKAI